ncbi:MAG: isoprenylcysteine carboxylmethyltransferase family protein [Anaerolineaceae bacterium]|nr:isoprenylcysteine carboxylmethyltransferase family protein [Anaerolineaceae bacterium]MBN2677574.1 isoprenylcysteine carboxylmethyltransferase family protein [Anaerolineaceae bacterium]
MKNWKCSWTVVGLSVLLVIQYILTFFVYKLTPYAILQWLGWAIWLISIYFAIAPIFILKKKGGVAKGTSYVNTTQLVDTNLYAIVRHPQYLAGILFSISLMLLSAHWLVLLLGIISSGLIYVDIQMADQEGLQQFGDTYREYMGRVPQINFLAGIVRQFRKRH